MVRNYKLWYTTVNLKVLICEFFIKDNDKTTQFLLFYLNKHVEALNSIYNSLPFFDSTKENYYIGLQFMIYRTKVFLFAKIISLFFMNDKN